MASRLTKVWGFRNKIGQNNLFRRRTNLFVVPSRNIEVYSDVGAIKEMPDQVRFGLMKIAVIVFPFLYVGAEISKTGAAFLEENDIFVPDDDDD